MSTDPKKMFLNLAPGDVVTAPVRQYQLLVLNTRGEDVKWKHFGQICGCGEHVHGIPRLFRWDDEQNMPVTKDGKVLDIWLDVQVEKDVSGALAKKFANLAVNDDQPGDETVAEIFKNNPDFLKAIEVGHYSHARPGVTAVAMIRALGGTLSQEQAILVAAAMETHASVSASDHMNSLSILLGALSGVEH